MRAGKYGLREKVGEGTAGEVWKAWDSILGRSAALKLLKHADADDRVRFEREARAAARIHHPNIAGVYDSGEADGRPFIAMQFVDGRRLDRADGDLRRAVTWVRDAARAVHAAHGSGILHRDLKPANILVERDSDRVFVTDFGLARQVAVDAPISATGTIVAKCLEREAPRRYATAEDLARALTRYLAGEPILAVPPGPIERLRRRLAKRRGLVAALEIAPKEWGPRAAVERRLKALERRNGRLAIRLPPATATRFRPTAES